MIWYLTAIKLGHLGTKEYVKPLNPEIHKMQIFFSFLCKWDQSKIEGEATRR